MHPRENLGTWEVIWGTCVLITWAASFLLGLLVPSNKLMSRVWGDAPIGFMATVAYSVAILLSHSITNTLLLVCTSTVLGSMAQRWQVSDQLADVPSSAQYTCARRFYFDAILRGFFVYLLFIGGYILITDIRFEESSSFNGYVRIAGAASILGFVVGYDPNLIVRFIQRVIEALPGVEPSSAATSPETGLPETQEAARKKELSALSN